MSEYVGPAALLDKRQARAAFERAATSYDASAVLQREIANRMLDRLDVIRRDPRRVADVGCGTGHCSRALQQRYRRARVFGVDIADPMLDAARSQAGWRGRQYFVCGDAEALPIADASVDMIVSNLTLQWCDPDKVLREFARIIRPGGVVMFSSFGPDTLKELRSAWGSVDDRPHVHSFIDMHDLGDAIIRAGLVDPVMDVEHFTVTYADVMAILRDLKNLGAHNVSRERHRGLTGKSRFARFKSAYEAQARNGVIPASYEAVYGHAWAPEPRRDGQRRQRTPVVPVRALQRRKP
ncbi:MAG: malonyl-ACP O-methyltransferase BioC [Acidiferrobacterales bacterium]